MLNPLVFPYHRANSDIESQTYYDFRIYLLCINLTWSIKTHIVSKEKQKGRKKTKHSKFQIKPFLAQETIAGNKIPRREWCPCVCVYPKKVTEYWNPWGRLGCFSSQLFTFLTLRIFILRFWEKNILNKCPKSYLVLKKSQNSCPHFKSVFFRPSCLSAYYAPEEAFPCLLWSASSVQLEESNLFCHLGTSLPITKWPPAGKEHSPFTNNDGSFLFLFHDIPFWEERKKKKKHKEILWGYKHAGSGYKLISQFMYWTEISESQ